MLLSLLLNNDATLKITQFNTCIIKIPIELIRNIQFHTPNNEFNIAIAYLVQICIQNALKAKSLHMLQIVPKPSKCDFLCNKKMVT